MTKNHDRKWVFVLGGPETQLHDILWAVHDGENRGRGEGEENIGGVPGYGGWSGPSDAQRFAHFFRTHTRVCARRCALTEPERGIGL